MEHYEIISDHIINSDSKVITNYFKYIVTLSQYNIQYCCILIENVCCLF